MPCFCSCKVVTHVMFLVPQEGKISEAVGHFKLSY